MDDQSGQGPKTDLPPMKRQKRPRRSGPVTREDLIEDLRYTVDRLEQDKAARGDLKILSRALRELRFGFRVFSNSDAPQPPATAQAQAEGGVKPVEPILSGVPDKDPDVDDTLWISQIGLPSSGEEAARVYVRLRNHRPLPTAGRRQGKLRRAVRAHHPAQADLQGGPVQGR